MSDCLSDSDIRNRHASTFDDAARRRMDRHLAGCTGCREREAEYCAAQDALFDEILEVCKAHGQTPTLANSSSAVVGAHQIGNSRLMFGGLPTGIGRYEIIRELGRGGMGVVYEAEQERPKRRVALKIINPGVTSPQALRRFELEADILGRLRHANIAQVYEAGTAELSGMFPENREEQAATAGSTDTVPNQPAKPADALVAEVSDQQPINSIQVPFFAMEFIEGMRLTRFAVENQLGTRDRLELIAKICDGVHHAHQKGVIHRDLKPANILVDTSGQPKILDFGVARATDSDIQATTRQTDMGQIIGTVPYMSPEQAGGDPNDLDARSDVYALGVVTYELLAGRLPHDVGGRMLHDAVRVIREDDPIPLSSINRLFRGDVEIMVGKALAKEKERRYQSASEFASDIERYLVDQPIVARPPSAMYQIRKFAKRNKALVGGAAATFIFLIAGASGTTWQAVVATGQRNRAQAAETKQRRARKDAESARDKAEQLVELITKALISSDPHRGGEQGLLVTESMEQTIELLDGGKLIDQPATDAALRLTISRILNGNARSKEALRLAEQALDTNRKLYPNDHPDVAMSLNVLAHCLTSQNRPAEALPRFEAALAMYQRLLEGDRPEVAWNLNNLGYCLQLLGRLEDALRNYEAALAMRQRLFEGDHPYVAESMNNVAACLKDMGRSAEALPVFEATLEMYQRLYDSDNPAVARGLNNIAWCLESLGRSSEALPGFEAALEMYQRCFVGDHPAEAQCMDNAASCLRAMGRWADALPRHEEALAMRKRLFDDDHPDTAQSLTNTGVCLQNLGRPMEALAKHEAALEMYQRLIDGDHANIATSLNNVAACFYSMGRLTEALPVFEAALEMNQRLFESDQPLVALGLNNVAACLNALGRSDEALPMYEAALEMRQRIFEGDSPDVAQSLNNVAYCLQSLGQPADALPMYIAALDMDRRLFAGDHPDVLTSLNNVATCLQALGRSEEAFPIFEEGLELAQRLFPSDHPFLAKSFNNLGVCLRSLGRTEEALVPFEEALKIRQRLVNGKDLEYAINLHNVGGCLQFLGRSSEARTMFEEAIEMHKAMLPPGHPHRLFPQIGLAKTLVSLGRYAEAEPLLLDAAEQCERSEACRRMHWRNVLEGTIQLYDTWHVAEPNAGHDQKAAEWRAKLPSESKPDSAE